MKKKKNNTNKVYFFILLILLFLACYEIKNDYRIGGIFRDLFFSPFELENKENLFTYLNKELEEENSELKELLDIDYSLTDFDIINASVVVRNNSYWLNEFTINKGINDGIEKAEAVVVKEGLIGEVVSTSFNTSIIRLIISFNKPISVLVNDINKELFVEDYKLYIKGINEIDKIKIGDKVVTSGLSNMYPRGILIGEVSDIKRNDDGVGFIASINLSSNINDIKFVSVLKRKNK